jgi:hypothetical protein
MASEVKNDLAAFQVALRRELANLKCPLPAPLTSATVFPRAWRGRAALVHWRRGDSSAAEWAAAVRKRHGWCCEIPPGVFLLDLDRAGVLELLLPKLPQGYGLVESSPGKYHIWLCGTVLPGNHLGRLDESILEVHGAGRLATLPPSLHVDTSRPYRWARAFAGTRSITPQDIGIVVDIKEPEPSKAIHRPLSPPPGAVPLHELMVQLTGQDGRPIGHEWAFHCPKHDDKHASLMVSDEKGLFFCHGAGCGFKGNQQSLEKLLGIRHPRVIAEVRID